MTECLACGHPAILHTAKGTCSRWKVLDSGVVNGCPCPGLTVNEVLW